VVRTAPREHRGLALVGIDIRRAILPKNGESFVDKNSATYAVPNMVTCEALIRERRKLASPGL
jgi:hypothetical protein